MKQDDFTADRAAHLVLVREHEPPYWAFVPPPLPPGALDRSDVRLRRAL